MVPRRGPVCLFGQTLEPAEPRQFFPASMSAGNHGITQVEFTKTGAIAFAAST
jgi:hypothetical protein